MPRDITKPYTEDELVLIRGIFLDLPTYNAAGEYALSSDVGELFRRMDYPRTAEQLASYELYWNLNFEGKIPLEDALSSIRNSHSLRQLFIDRAAVYDTDRNGIITADEFEELLKIAVIHEPKLQNTTFEDFLTEADTNKDGQVSIEECGAWLEKHANI